MMHVLTNLIIKHQYRIYACECYIQQSHPQSWLWPKRPAASVQRMLLKIARLLMTAGCMWNPFLTLGCLSYLFTLLLWFWCDCLNVWVCGLNFIVPILQYIWFCVDLHDFLPLIFISSAPNHVTTSFLLAILSWASGPISISRLPPTPALRIVAAKSSLFQLLCPSVCAPSMGLDVWELWYRYIV